MAFGAIAVAATLLAGCASGGGGGGGGGGSGSGKPSQYVLGASLILSTSQSTSGQQFNEGINTAIGLINSTGGIDGAKAVVKEEDMQGTAQGAVSAFNELKSVYGVQALIQSTSAGVLASAPIANSSKILMLNPGGFSPVLTGLGPQLVSVLPNLTNDIAALAPYLYTTKGYRRLVVYGEDDALGTGTGAAMQKAWQKLGGTYLGTYLEDSTSESHNAVINQIKSKNPDIVLVICAATQFSTFVTQAKQLGLTAQLAATSLSTGVGPIAAGSAINNMYYSEPAIAVDPSTNKLAAEYVKEFNKLYPNQTALPYTLPIVISNFNAVWVWKTAIEYLNAHNEAYNGANLRSAISAIKTFALPSGNLTISSGGTVSTPVGIYQWVGPPVSAALGDKDVLIKTLSLAELGH
jgi:ABC-type branched-subunit amino acid transport system substrate-binding protein